MGYFFSLSKETAEHLLNVSELTLLVCGLVLAYGAAGEYLEEHDKLPRWMKWSRKPRLIFVWMVAISLFGEFAGDAGVYICSGQLQSIQDSESLSLRRQVEDERLKRVQLQSRIADTFGPRQLTPEQSAGIVGRLGGLKGVKIDVFVPALASPYNPTEVSDTLNTGIAVVRTLRAAHMDVGGWVVDSCQPIGGANLVFQVKEDDPTAQKSADGKTAQKVLAAFTPEIGTWPRVEPSYLGILACTTFSPLNGIGQNKRAHDAAISITIGIKVNPLLTREMLEPENEKK